MLLAASLVLTVLPMASLAADPPATHVFISEGAEESTYDQWDAQWERYDANNNSDSDYWCRTTHNVHGGDRAIYCARVGYNSHYMMPVKMGDGSTANTQPWNVNITGLPANATPSSFVYRYDTGQDSIMRKNLVGASYYGQLTMTFWFWSQTGASDAVQPGSNLSVGYDFLNAVYYTGSGDGLVKHVLWTDSYAQATARSWTSVTISVPRNATMVAFEFVSGTKAPAGGDGLDRWSADRVKVVNDGMLEGVYLDDITLSGTDPLPVIPLATAVEALGPLQNDHYFPVSYSINEPTAPMAYTYLFYRQSDSGPWTQYTSASNPDGRFYDGPIMFLAPSDGHYEFFTQGFDQTGTSEDLRNTPDTTTTVDTLAPITSLAVNGAILSSGDYSAPISFTLDPIDEGSGVNATSYRIDNGPWTRYNGSAVVLSSVGSHVVQYYSTDLAGSAEAVETKELRISSSGAVAGTGLFGPIGNNEFLLIGIAAMGVVAVGIVVAAKRRKGS